MKECAKICNEYSINMKYNKLIVYNLSQVTIQFYSNMKIQTQDFKNIC